MMKRQLGTAAVLAMLGLCSCASERPATVNVASRTYNTPASEVVAALPSAIAAEPMKLGIEKAQHGTLQTAWKDGYQGNFHIARYWQERTRFEVSVVPDWQSPQTACRVDVREQTQERSNSRASWSRNETTARPERAADLMKQIDAKLGAAPMEARALTGTPAAMELAQPGQPAATAWDTRSGVGVLTVPGTLAQAWDFVSAEVKKAGLQVLYERAGEKQAVMQARKDQGPVITILCEMRPGNLTRLTLRQPEGDNAGASLFQALQAKRTGTPAK